MAKRTVSLSNYLDNYSQLDADSLIHFKNCVDEYPYCQITQMLYLLNLKQLGDYTFKTNLPRVAIAVSNRKKLKAEVDKIDTLMPDKSIIEGKIQAGILDNMRNDALKKIQGKSSTIEISLPITKSNNQSTTMGLPIREKKIDKSKSLIDRFIEANPTISKIKSTPIETDESKLREIKEEKSVTENYFLSTETLAELYLSQGAKQNALIIYQHLSKLFPEKKTYYLTKIESIKKHN